MSLYMYVVCFVTVLMLAGRNKLVMVIIDTNI